MSAIDTDIQTDGEPASAAAAAPALSFFERSLLGINLWATYAITALWIIKEHSYFGSESFFSLAYGWLFLCILSVISFGMWQFLQRGRIRTGVAVVCFMIFNLVFGGPFNTFEKKPEPRGKDQEEVIMIFRFE